MRKISIDFDEVLYNLNEATQKFLEKTYNETVDRKNITYWSYLCDNFPKIVECWSKFEHYSQGNFFDGAQDFMSELRKKYDVTIVTSTPVTIENEKDEMIKDYLGDVNIIHASNKHIHTKGSTLIDDGPHNIIGHYEKNEGDVAIIFDLDGEYGWNKDVQENDRILRATSYEDVLKIIHNLK